MLWHSIGDELDWMQVRAASKAYLVIRAAMHQYFSTLMCLLIAILFFWVTHALFMQKNLFNICYTNSLECAERWMLQV